MFQIISITKALLKTQKIFVSTPRLPAVTTKYANKGTHRKTFGSRGCKFPLPNPLPLGRGEYFPINGYHC